VISTTVSATVAFIGNRYWTWRDRAGSSLHREYGLYAIFNIVGLLIGLACLFISHELLGAWQPRIFHSQLADTVAKNGFGLVLGTMFRFWSYRRYVFSTTKPEAPTIQAVTAGSGD
jgi:putative flippase GtrA